MIESTTNPDGDRPLSRAAQSGSETGHDATDDPIGPSLAAAHQAIERGDYDRVVRLLEPLTERHPARTVAGAQIRLLLATALMGQGQSEAAALWCRSLRACQDPDLRARGRDLQLILEAPALQRPRDWSITMPDLAVTGSLESLGATARNQRRRRKPDPPPPPPVGPTRPPLGFAALVGLLLVLLLLASLLGGCMEVRTDLRFAGPGRLQISHHLRSTSGTLTPWQRRLADSLSHQGFRSREQGATTLLRTAVLPLDQARAALAATLQAAEDLGAGPLPGPSLILEERNWLLGVHQRLLLELDLRQLSSLPGLDLSVRLQPVRLQSVIRAEPARVKSGSDAGVIWPLRAGCWNRIELRCWRWNPLGIGAAAIALLLPLVLVLQRLRVQLGLGLPELPA